MQIKQPRKDATNMFESLHRGEYYVWPVAFSDGTSERVRIKNDKTSKVAIEKHFGKPIDHIDYQFSIHGGAPDGQLEQREGSAGGINRIAPATNVSYANVLDEVAAQFSTILQELSFTKLSDYKDAAASEKSFKTRPLRKLSKSVKGVADADRKIAGKSGPVTKPDAHMGRQTADVTNEAHFMSRLNTFLEGLAIRTK